MKTQIEPHRILTLWTAETESHIQLPPSQVRWRARPHDAHDVQLPMIPQYKFGIVEYVGNPEAAYARGWQEVETLELIVALNRYISDHNGRSGPYPDALHNLMRIALRCASIEIEILRNALKPDDQSELGEDGVRELIG